jgi:UDP-N-acetylmuramate--alanine ligase
VDRRFQLRGQACGITVADDYGHHPTEIKATLAAARQCGYRKIHVVFQPHRYTRTRDLFDRFATAFGDADTLLMLDIFAASEPPIEGVTAEHLADQIRRAGHRAVRYVSSFAEAAEAASLSAKEGDLVFTLGAGNVHQVGPMILDKIQARRPVAAGK